MDIRLGAQALGLLLGLLTGAAQGLAYDILRPPRHGSGPLAGALLDALFCLAAGGGVFALAMSSGSGRLGTWELAAALAGFLLYMRLLSPPVLRAYMSGLSAGEAVAALCKRNIEKITISAKLFFQKLRKCFIIKK